jgi:hypothetical protein
MAEGIPALLFPLAEEISHETLPLFFQSLMTLYDT